MNPPLIHPTAVIHPSVQLGADVRVGPYTVIDEHVQIGTRCVIGPHCHLTGHTTLGDENEVHAGCVLGGTPQDLAFRDATSHLTIGHRNKIREHVTIHRGTTEGSATIIGDDNFLMAHCHVGHNCTLGNHVIVVNGVLLGGYVEVQDRAFLGGGAVVHQHCRIGTLAMIRGLSRISKDVPPFCMAVENNELVGLNAVGLKRSGFAPDQRSNLKGAYSILFMQGLNLTQGIEAVQKKALTSEVHQLLEFIQKSKRGVGRPRSKPTDLGEQD